MKEAKYYKQIGSNVVECQLCNHFCKINDGQIGICRVRMNKGGKLFSLVYGYPTSLNVDPIEKKPLFHFFPGSLSYSIGAFGCNLACQNCLNWKISQAKNITEQVRHLDNFDPERIVEEAIVNDCKSISYTYNEPTVFAEYALDTMRLAQMNGLKNVWVSNGYMTNDLRKDLIPYLDAVNIDLKSIDEKFYKEKCMSELQPILDNLVQFKREQIHLEVTTLLVPDLYDDLDAIERIANFISLELDTDTPWHLTRFLPGPSWMQKDKKKTGEGLVYEAYQIAKDHGLNYVYSGNLPGDQKENTYCPKCGELAIRRMGAFIERLDISGTCSHCERNLDIVE